MEELARALGVSEKKLAVMRGEKSSKKSILVQGITRDQAQSVLARKLAMTDIQKKAEKDDRGERE